ncbi:hypothetical protein G7083_05295 [Vibrio sp. HDW18]|uniref:hypothetical protein n=1 Tax=Vibrio TaxID=662 RepID=UPI00140DD872|nr:MULTISPECIES: hypothetical protein [unclassified Vibrio]QIL85352.1 hypothetical protein G7083_05295 [Vibrio sp. HDW18]
MKHPILIILCLSFSLLGCSSGRPDNAGPAIDIYPVHSSLALRADGKNHTQAQAAFEQFLAEQRHSLLTQNSVLYWRTKSGEKFALNAQKQLRKLGVAAESVRLEKMPAQLGDRFDFKIEIITHRVVVPMCAAAQISQFGQEGNGCVSESLRWQSMVSPQKMLSNHPIGSANSAVGE